MRAHYFIIFLFLLLLSCTKTILCSAPYIEYKTGECCLDKDANTVCDNDEVGVQDLAPPVAVPVVQETVVLTPSTPKQFIPEEALSAVVTIVVKDRHYDDLLGSGFFFQEGGFIVTNAHVIEPAIFYEDTVIEVEAYDHIKYNAKLVGYNGPKDVAVLKLIDTPQHKLVTETFPYLTIGDSNKAKSGDTVYVLGAPYGLESSIAKGIVSGTHRTPSWNETLDVYLQTDAAINPGNSGGPLVNAEGEVIGLSTWGYEETEGLNFALESNEFKELVENFVLYKCSYWECYNEGYQFKDINRSKVMIKQPYDVRFSWVDNKGKTYFESYTLKMKTSDGIDRMLCARTRIINEGETLYDEISMPVEVKANDVPTHKFTLNFWTPYQYNFYYEGTVSDCETGEEFHQFYGMWDFSRDYPVLLFPKVVGW
jgi:S1-C subfamily serine protease